MNTQPPPSPLFGRLCGHAGVRQTDELTDDDLARYLKAYADKDRLSPRTAAMYRHVLRRLAA